MPGGKIPIGSANLDFIDNLQAATEGNLSAGSYVPPQQPTAPTFIRMVVLDVIFDPNNDVSDQKKQLFWSVGSKERDAVSNPEYTNVLPRNTIVARRVGSDLPPMFVFPFFPSHLSMPCKAGESVWVMLEKPSTEQAQMAFWFCRISEPHPSDDVNHSHHANAFEPTSNPKLQDLFSNEKAGAPGEEAWSELRNGPVVLVNGERKTSADSVLLRNAPEDIFERLIQKSDASRLTVYEAVPRFRKRPGDLAFEGSNNTLIVLGTDRSGRVAEYASPVEDDEKLTRTKVVKYPTDDFRESAGSIDMVAGRGQLDRTFGKETKTTSIKGVTATAKGKEIKKEIDKSLSAIKKSEGDPDYENDRSRILISQRTSPDTKFKISDHNGGFDPPVSDSTEGDAAIVIKSDKVRIIARSDIQMLVTNYADGESVVRKKIKLEETDVSKWASITIKRTGDIVFTPSEEGYIMLGDDQADRALLCTDSPAIKAGGAVSPATPPLSNTMGGKLGGTQIPTQGTWAKKVLVTGAR